MEVVKKITPTSLDSSKMQYAALTLCIDAKFALQRRNHANALWLVQISNITEIVQEFKNRSNCYAKTLQI